MSRFESERLPPLFTRKSGKVGCKISTEWKPDGILQRTYTPPICEPNVDYPRPMTVRPLIGIETYRVTNLTLKVFRCSTLSACPVHRGR